MVKRISSLMLVLTVIFCMVSCAKSEYSHCELVLPLSKDFYESEDELYDKFFTDGNSSVAVLRISFAAAILEGISDAHTPMEFGKYWLKQCGRVAVIKSEENADFCEYYDSSTGFEYYYLTAFYRSQYAYFVVLFMAKKENEDAARVKFLDYARGAYFKDWVE